MADEGDEEPSRDEELASGDDDSMSTNPWNMNLTGLFEAAKATKELEKQLEGIQIDPQVFQGFQDLRVTVDPELLQQLNHLNAQAFQNFYTTIKVLEEASETQEEKKAPDPADQTESTYYDWIANYILSASKSEETQEMAKAIQSTDSIEEQREIFNELYGSLPLAMRAAVKQATILLTFWIIGLIWADMEE